MSETKVVRNTGSSINVEYAGSSFHFPANSETVVPADLADVAQYRHGHAGLNIVHHEAEAAALAEADAKADLAAKAELEDAAAVPASGPRSFVCPAGDYSSNDEAGYEAHRATHLPAASDPDPVVATEPSPDAVVVPVVPVVPVESPSSGEPPAVAEIPSTEPVKES